jgi:hypothetical protein
MRARSRFSSTTSCAPPVPAWRVLPLAAVLDVVPLAPRDWLLVAPFALAPAVIGQALKVLMRTGG